MPEDILLAYEAFQRSLVVYNQIGTTLGTPHTHTGAPSHKDAPCR